MPRTQSSDRLLRIIDAAVQVFIGKGYRRAQMSDIAHAAGVSQGTLYNYVESKDALFYLLLDRGFTDAPATDAAELPIRTPAFGDLLGRARDRITSEMQVIELDRALTRSAVADPRAELETIIRQCYAAVQRLGRGLDLVERSAVDIPELAQLFYIERRRSIVALLTRYLESRIKLGAIRPLPDPPTAARLILETIVWFAQHRCNTPDSEMISDHAALETTVDFLVNGLIAHPVASASVQHPETEKKHAGAGRRVR